MYLINKMIKTLKKANLGDRQLSLPKNRVTTLMKKANQELISSQQV